MITNLVNKLLAMGALVSHGIIILAIFYFLAGFFRPHWIRRAVFSRAAGFFKKNGLLLAFLVALVSTMASLFYSEIAGFAPCNLCWFQRIFMYPLVLLLGLAWIKKDSHVVSYALWLSFIGFLISLFQNYLYYSTGGLNVLCQFASAGASCVKRYVFEFGYITIPMMALTGFMLIIMLLLFAKQKSHGSHS